MFYLVCFDQVLRSSDIVQGVVGLIRELRVKLTEDEIIMEYDIKSLAFIDVLRIDSVKIYYTYEVKRKTSSIASVSQIIRYV